MIKDKENVKPMQAAGQREGKVSSLFRDEVPVWYDRSGKVCPKWTSRCTQEREQTMHQLSGWVTSGLQKLDTTI